MRLREVEHVDVVADRGAVVGRVVGAVDGEGRPAVGRSQDVGDEVRFGVVALAVPLGGAGNVEVPERRDPEPVRLREPAGGSLEGPLRLAVDVDRTERRILRDRRGLGDAVDSGR